MCEKGWKNKKLNPSNIKTITRQYLHDPSIYKNNKIEIRSATSSDHVDIMGNTEMLFDILYIASGNDEKVQNQIYQSSLSDPNKNDLFLKNEEKIKKEEKIKQNIINEGIEKLENKIKSN